MTRTVNRGAALCVASSVSRRDPDVSSAHQASGSREALAGQAGDAVALARQTDALERISRGDSMQSVLTALASGIEQNRPGAHCTFLILDEADGGRLFTIASPSLPSSFSDLIDGTAIGPHVGTCGRAAFARHDVVTEDIGTDPDWAEWRALALDHGLRACWSVPVIAPDTDGEVGKVLGTFATYFETNRGPDDDERRDVARTTALATIVLMRNRDEGELRRANLRDPLTGLANRRLFIDELSAALRRARRRRADVTVLFLDIDQFKVLNDSMGHLVGDEVLRVVANRVQQAVRPHDVVARFGGDEFTISCEGLTGAAEAEGLARELRQAIEAPVQVDDREVFLTVSVGIARGAGWESPHDLVADADAAMYQAKAAGRASVITFDERMREQSRDRLHMESALRRAIEKGGCTSSTSRKSTWLQVSSSGSKHCCAGRRTNSARSRRSSSFRSPKSRPHHGHRRVGAARGLRPSRSMAGQPGLVPVAVCQRIGPSVRPRFCVSRDRHKCAERIEARAHATAYRGDRVDPRRSGYNWSACCRAVATWRVAVD